MALRHDLLLSFLLALSLGRSLLALELVGGVALAAVLSVLVLCHEAALARRVLARAAQSSHLAVRIDLVVLQHSKFDLLVHVRFLLGRRVGFLFVLLATTAQSEDEVERRLLLDVVIRERATVLELLAGEDEALLIRGDAYTDAHRR